MQPGSSFTLTHVLVEPGSEILVEEPLDLLSGTRRRPSVVPSLVRSRFTPSSNNPVGPP